MTSTVFIDGDQGTTGLRIRALLADRGDLSLAALPDAQRKDPDARARAIDASDVAILCLPDAAARDVVARLRNPAARVLDASSAHRTAPGWTYGLPELDASQPARIAEARRVSNPGCYPTAAVLLMRPLLDAGLLPADHPVSIHAVSGYSGQGRAGVERHEGPARASAPAFEVYGLGLEHKHVPEIATWSGLRRRPIFVPSYGAFRQGIVLTVPLHLDTLARGADAASIHACLAARYDCVAHVEVVPLDAAREISTLDPQEMNGTDRIRLLVLHHAAHGHVVLAAVLDNLGKGAAGAAVQNLDLMLGAARR